MRSNLRVLKSEFLWQFQFRGNLKDCIITYSYSFLFLDNRSKERCCNEVIPMWSSKPEKQKQATSMATTFHTEDAGVECRYITLKMQETAYGKCCPPATFSVQTFVMFQKFKHTLQCQWAQTWPFCYFWHALLISCIFFTIEKSRDTVITEVYNIMNFWS